MDIENLIELYPRLYHMATAGSWPSIETNGLWTTEQIATTAGLDDEQVNQLLRERRVRSVQINHPTLGPMTVRDQLPLRLALLERSLTDLTVEQWLETLNNRVFFWLHESRLERLLSAQQYRNEEHDVLVVDTRSLVEAYRDRVRLAPMNTGSTLFPNNLTRGTNTFARVEDFDYDARRRGRSLPDRVVELAVLDGVHDVSRYVVGVQRRRGSAIVDEVAFV
jgi:hypothetical protein